MIGIDQQPGDASSDGLGLRMLAVRKFDRAQRPHDHPSMPDVLEAAEAIDDDLPTITARVVR